MGFFDDFIKDAIALNTEIENFKQEVISSFTESTDEIKQTVVDTKSEIQQSSGKAMDIVKQSTDINS